MSDTTWRPRQPSAPGPSPSEQPPSEESAENAVPFVEARPFSLLEAERPLAGSEDEDAEESPPQGSLADLAFGPLVTGDQRRR